MGREGYAGVGAVGEMWESQGEFLSESVTVLAGIGEKRAALLANLNIFTVGDLFFHFPRAHEDRREITPIDSVKEDEAFTIQAEVVSARVLRLRRRLAAAEATLRDETGRLRAIWFGKEYLAQVLKPGTKALFTGPIGRYKGLALRNPEYELLSGDEEDRLNTGRIVPVYRLTEGLTQRMLRRMVRAALDALAGPVEETLPLRLRSSRDFPAIEAALRGVHFPGELEEARRARERFVYEELLGIQLGILRARAARRDGVSGHQHIVDGPLIAALRESLPFELTAAQRRALNDILEDMASPRPMVRLLQGDVGCGKTVVALHAIAAAADGGYQTALMTPTEILAEQHGLTLRRLLETLGLRVAILTRSTADSAEVRRQIARGELPVVVGTHALIQEGVAFRALGLAIIDEQHRFGVLQRSALVDKGLNPDILHMTATPIPRTLAITVYGGMDITVIDELPPGRVPAKTRRIALGKVPALHDYIRREAAAGSQTYYVCPVIEESESHDVSAVTRRHRELSQGPFADLRTGLLHGRLPTSEKEEIMERFQRGALDVLFTTSVIEVGIDCPNATVMVIEDAGQFGLTQLHQLRGRVGRGSRPGHCFLLGKPKTKEGLERLRILCRTTDGFEIAEADLALRGPGEFHGIKQTGLSDLRIADLVRDVRLLDIARRDARDILACDPHLADPAHRHLAAAARRFQELNA